VVSHGFPIIIPSTQSRHTWAPRHAAPPGAAEEQRLARTLLAEYKGEATTLAGWLLERMDRLYPPRADGCRALKGLRHLLAGDHYLMSTFLAQVS
jgi:hypothetical protein